MAENPGHKNLDKPPYSQEEVYRVIDEHAKKVLEDREIISLVSSPGPVTIDSAIDWFGGKDIENQQRPIHRFSTILANNFDKIPNSEKAQFISGAARFVLLDFQQQFDFPMAGYNYRRSHTRIRANIRYTSSHIENIGTLFLKALNLNKGDVQSARRLITQSLSGTRLGSRNSALLTFLAPKQFDKKSREFVDQDPELSALAFWVDVDMGDFSPKSSIFTQLLQDIYPRANSLTKIQILTYIREGIITGKISGRTVGDVRLFLTRNEHAQESADLGGDKDLFAEIAITKNALALNELFNKFQSKEIVVDDLITFLENNPQMDSLVGEEYLQDALNKTSEHGLALRIEKLIARKKASGSNL